MSKRIKRSSALDECAGMTCDKMPAIMFSFRSIEYFVGGLMFLITPVLVLQGIVEKIGALKHLPL